MLTNEYVITSLIAIVVYFLKKIVDKLEKNNEEIHAVKLSLREMSTTFIALSKDVERASQMGEEARAKNELIAVMKRDLETAFLRIDELRKDR